jgi:hypothetical protein
MVRLGDNIVGEENEEASVDSARVSLDDSHDPYFPPVVTLPLVEVLFCKRKSFYIITAYNKFLSDLDASFKMYHN